MKVDQLMSMIALLVRQIMKAGSWVCLLSVVGVAEVSASQLAEDEVADPLRAGSTCSGYRYLSPPRVDENELPLGLVGHDWTLSNIWFCPDSGYASYGFDFIPDDVENQRLSAHLDEIAGLDFERFSKLEQLVWMERLYRIRGRSPALWSTFYRAMYRNLGELQRSHAAGRVLQVFKENRDELEGQPLQLFGMATMFSQIGWNREACVCYMQGRDRFTQLIEEGNVSGEAGVSLLLVYSSARERVLSDGSSCSRPGDDGEGMVVVPLDVRCGDVFGDY